MSNTTSNIDKRIGRVLTVALVIQEVRQVSRKHLAAILCEDEKSEVLTTEVNTLKTLGFVRESDGLLTWGRAAA